MTSPSFVSASLTLPPGPPTAGGNDRRRQSLVLCYFNVPTSPTFSLHYDDRDFSRHSEARLPRWAAYSMFLVVVGTCNGLVCLSEQTPHDVRILSLWNPHIRKFLHLPPPRDRDFDPHDLIRLTGFGIGSGADDFKVLSVVAVSDCRDGNVIPLVSDLYSLRTRSWNSIPSGALNYVLIPDQTLAFASGRLHGIARADGKSRNLVLVFDLRTETYSEIMLPKCLTKVPASELSVKSFGDSSSSTISVVRSEKRLLPVEPDGSAVKNFEICVMRQYREAESWDKAYDGIPLPGTGEVSLLGFKRNDEAFTGFFPGMDTLELKDGTSGSVGFLRAGNYLSFIGNYVQSLALLEKGSFLPAFSY